MSTKTELSKKLTQALRMGSITAAQLAASSKEDVDDYREALAEYYRGGNDDQSRDAAATARLQRLAEDLANATD